MKGKISFFAILLGLALSVQAQPHTIDWQTIAGGGSTSTGAGYSVNATVGQPFASVASAGTYTLMGGFWSIMEVVQTPGAPELTLERAGGNVIVSWPTGADGFVLEATDALDAAPSWAPIPGPYESEGDRIMVVVPIVQGRQYFRLRED